MRRSPASQREQASGRSAEFHAEIGYQNDTEHRAMATNRRLQVSARGGLLCASSCPNVHRTIYMNGTTVQQRSAEQHGMGSNKELCKSVAAWLPQQRSKTTFCHSIWSTHIATDLIRCNSYSYLALSFTTTTDEMTRKRAWVGFR